MKKTIVPIILGIFLISFISAIIIYSGESITLELDKPFAYYSIVGNSTPILLDIVQEGNNVTITLDKYSQDDTFDLIFFDREKEVITIYSGGGGGSSKTIYKDRNITEYIEVEKIVEKEVEVQSEPEIIEKVPMWIIIFGAMVFVIGILVTFLLMKKSFEKAGLMSKQEKEE
jgi:hypothetical protein